MMLAVLLAALLQAIPFANLGDDTMIPTPQPQATPPIDFDQFCLSHHAGHNTGSIAAPVVIITCQRFDLKWDTSPKCDLRKVPYRDSCWLKINNLPGVDNERAPQ